MSGSNERLWQTLDSKIHTNSNLRNKTTRIFSILLIFIFLQQEKTAPLYISPHLAHNLLNDQLWMPLL